MSSPKVRAQEFDPFFVMTGFAQYLESERANDNRSEKLRLPAAEELQGIAAWDTIEAQREELANNNPAPRPALADEAERHKARIKEINDALQKQKGHLKKDFDHSK